MVYDTMKDLFPGYYHNPDFKKLFEECIFVFDSSVLLSVYELPKKDTKNLFNALENGKICERLWIPHQVALEYQRNRWNSIKKQNKKIDIQKKLSEIVNDIENLDKDLKKLSMLQHEYINTKEISGEIQKLLPIINDLKRHNEPNLLINDKIRNRIDKLFKDKIGPSYTEKALEKIYKEGEKRFKNKIPPGYEDENKETAKKYGDLILWKQMMNYAKSNKKPIFFITNEKKGDWWFKGDTGNLLGPQAELVQEFTFKTGQIFHLYRLPIFLKLIKEYLEVIVGEDTVEHIEEIVEQNELLELLGEEFMDSSGLNEMKVVGVGPDGRNYEFKFSKSKLAEQDSGKLYVMMKVIKELSEEYGGRVPISIFEDEMIDRYNISERKTEKLLLNLKRRGMIFEPSKGYIKAV